MKKVLTVCLLFGVIGCGGIDPGKNPDRIDVTGTVTLKGKQVNDVVLNLQPTKGGVQATMPVKNGQVKGSVVPGTYTYYLSEGPKLSAFKEVPEKYRSGSMDRQMEINNATLTIAFE